MKEIQSGDEVNGRYVLKECKGRGTFGQVWLAYDRAVDEDVAIKFYVALDYKGREEFIQEFRIAAKLRHPNLLVTKDYGEWRDQPYLTMKYCGRGSAGDMVGTLQPCERDERTIWRFIHDVAAGLAYLHAVKPDPIVHQDIKPDNVLIDADGTFLVSDFGISKRIRNTMLKQSTRNLKAGAPAYMGPERFSANPEPILASDVWSLGVSIYELAEGMLPFSGMGGVVMQQGAEIPRLSPGWSQQLNDVMHFCLEKETWTRAKASDVEEIAATVLKDETNNNTFDSRATNRHVNTDGIDKKDFPSDSHVLSEPFLEPTPWLKRPVIWGSSAVIIVLTIMAIWYLPQRDETISQPEIVSTIDTLGTNQLAAIEEEKSETPSKKASTSNASSSKTVTVPPKPAVEKQSTSGTLNLGYASWTGSIRSGKPDGKGTMSFTSSHRIDSRDPKARVAEAGDRIEGTYINGHLDYGRWFKSDGSSETIMLGE